MLGDGDHRVTAAPHQRRQALLLATDHQGDRSLAERQVVEGLGDSPASPTDHTPSSAIGESAAGMPPTTAKERCSIAPDAVLATVGESRADRWRGSTTPLTPAHSALRRSAPRLRGSVIPAATRRKGVTPRRLGGAEVLERHRLDRAGERQDALGRLGPGLGVEPMPGHRLDGHPQPGRQLLNAIQLRRRILVLRQQDLADRAAPDGEQLQHGPPALDLVAAELLCSR